MPTRTEVDRSDEILTATDVARELGVRPRAVTEHVLRGRLAGQFVARRVLIRRGDLDAFKANREAVARA